jgi:hypothetical protein
MLGGFAEGARQLRRRSWVASLQVLGGFAAECCQIQKFVCAVE